MLTDLIVATPADAAAILESQCHATGWQTLQAKGVDHVKLASLRFILRGLPPDDEPVIQYMKSFVELGDGGEDGPWLQELPNDLVHLLAELPSASIPSLAEAWARTEEAILDRWSADDIRPLLGELSTFAKGALTQGKGLLLCVGL